MRVRRAPSGGQTGGQNQKQDPAGGRGRAAQEGGEGAAARAEIPAEGALEAVFGTVRPVFIMVTGWVMATSQILKKHTSTLVRYNAFVLLPAYHLFYQSFVIAAMFFVYQRHNQQAMEMEQMTCNDYKMDTMSKFGFIKNPTIVYRYAIKMSTVFVVSMVFAILFSYIVKNDVWNWRPRNLDEYRKLFSIYSAAYLGMAIIMYFVLTSILTDKIPAEEWAMIECPVSDKTIGASAPGIR
eukprot:jgi/Tetstr1/447252/TSEL_034689.t1